MSLRLPCGLGGDPRHQSSWKTWRPAQGEETAGQREEEALACLEGRQHQLPKGAAPAGGLDPVQAAEVWQCARQRSREQLCAKPSGGGSPHAGWWDPAATDREAASLLGEPSQPLYRPLPWEDFLWAGTSTSSSPRPRPRPRCDQRAHTSPSPVALQTDLGRTPYEPTQGQDMSTEATQRRGVGTPEVNPAGSGDSVVPAACHVVACDAHVQGGGR